MNSYKKLRYSSISKVVSDFIVQNTFNDSCSVKVASSIYDQTELISKFVTRTDCYHYFQEAVCKV